MPFVQVLYVLLSIGIFITEKTAFAAPERTHKCGSSILGIEMIGQKCDVKHPSEVKYIFPVTNMGEHDCEGGSNRVAGLIPLQDFYLEMVPLKAFLDKNKLPPFVKLLLVNGNC